MTELDKQRIKTSRSRIIGLLLLSRYALCVGFTQENPEAFYWGLAGEAF